ncbi:unnamed protein product [marine sediment metagenome]|uniref:Uncharacterized protein n=1 Tax=marine sediment metagenome TaxID=412755 RepID=X0Y4V6_9ZZZZ
MIEILDEKFRNEVPYQTSCLNRGVSPVGIWGKNRKDGTQYKKEQCRTAYGEKKSLFLSWKKHKDSNVEENKREDKRAQAKKLEQSP